MKTYQLVSEGYIVFTEIDGDSVTSGPIVQGRIKTRQVQNGTENVQTGTEKVQTGTESIQIRTDKVEIGSVSVQLSNSETIIEPTYEDQPVFEDVPVYENQPIFSDVPVYVTEEYSPWDELMATNPEIEPVLQAQLDEEAAAVVKEQARIDKLSAFTYNGVVCSVTESDQNGWASLLSLTDKIISLGGTFIPIPFNNENGNVVTLSSYNDYVEFIMAGATARMAFFN